MACTLTLTILSTSPPTSAGGWGLVTYQVGGTVDTAQVVDAYTKADGYFVNLDNIGGDGTYQLAIAPSFVGVELVVRVREDQLFLNTTCMAEALATVPAYVNLIDPSLHDAPRWEPVGGVLPNPVLLKVEAALATAQGVARPGLHVELELWRPAALAAFVTFRATVRTATQYVDAAPYLRAELAAAQRYVPGAAPFVDTDASLRFYYRFRVVDSAGEEPWLTRAGERYVVQAALPGATDTMAPFVADGTGRVASVFASGEAVQFVGCPLEVSVLLPPPTAPRWAEWRYVDAYGSAVEIRSRLLPDTLPAGVLRIPLPNDPPLCATAVEVAVVDTDRAFPGTCGHVLPTPLPGTGGTYADPAYGYY
jgi:hypothetical protein